MPALRKTAKIAGRRSEATELYLQGNSLRAVAEKLGCSHETVRSDVAAALKTFGDESREMLQSQKRSEYTELKTLLLPRVKNGDDSATALYLKTLAQESRCFGIEEPVRADSIALQTGPATINVLPQYADLVRPLVEAQERR